VRIAPSPGVIRRQNVSRYVDVAANVDGRDRDAVVADVESRLQDVAFPIEYHAEVLSADRQPVGRLISIGIAAAIGIFLLLQAFLGSWRLAALSFFTLPIAVAGGVLAALTAGGKLSLGSYIALFAVFGFATRSSVLLLDRFRHLQPEEGDALGAGIVLTGARERFAPVVMTGLATGLVFIAVLIIGGRPGYELLRPAAAVLLGGLVTSLLLTLFLLPVLYLRFGFSRAAEVPQAAVAQEPARGAVPGGVVVTEARAHREPGS
jgi:Cu/Ag efflux pump CusA